jgi:hypothetical protein
MDEKDEHPEKHSSWRSLTIWGNSIDWRLTHS